MVAAGIKEVGASEAGKGEQEISMETVALVVGILLLALVPLAGRHMTHLVASALLLSLAATSFNLLFGYTGLLSFGHALFWGVGGYTVAVMMARFGFGYVESVLAALVTSALMGVVIGFLCVRHTRIYFAILTLAFGQMFYGIAVKWDFLGGSDGIYGLPRPFNSLELYYYVVLVSVLVSLYVLRVITRSSLGLSFMAVRDNAFRAEFLGIGVRATRLKSFVISATFTGLAGALWVLLETAIGPESMFWTHSAEFVFVTLLGGPRVFLGPLVGGFIYAFLADVAMSLTEFWLFVIGVVLVGIVLFFPHGVLGYLLRVRAKAKTGSGGRTKGR